MEYVFSQLAEATGVWASRMGNAVGVTASSVAAGQGVAVSVIVFADACGPQGPSSTPPDPGRIVQGHGVATWSDPSPLLP